MEKKGEKMKDPLEQVMSEIVSHSKGLAEEIDQSYLPFVLRSFTLFGPTLDHQIDKTDILSFLIKNQDASFSDMADVFSPRFDVLSERRKKQIRKECISGGNLLFDILKKYCFLSLADLKKVILSINKLIPSELKEEEKEAAFSIKKTTGILIVSVTAMEKMFQLVFCNEELEKKKDKKDIIKITKRNALAVLPTFCNYIAMFVFGLYQKAYHFFLNTNEENEKKEIREQIKNIYNSVNGLSASFSTFDEYIKELKNNQKHNHEQVVKLVENRNEEEKPKRLEIAKCAKDICKILKDEYKTVVEKKTIEKYLRRFDTALEKGKKIALPSYKYAMFYNQEHFIVWIRETFIPYYLQHRKIKVKNKTSRRSSSDAAFDEAARQRYKEAAEEENDSY